MTAINLTITDAAERHIEKCIAKRGSGVGIKIGVKDSGCNGHSYLLDFLDEKPTGHQELVLSDRVSVFVTQADLEKYLNGLTLDYIQKGLNGVIRFINPNAENTCGCGESFNVKTTE